MPVIELYAPHGHAMDGTVIEIPDDWDVFRTQAIVRKPAWHGPYE